MFIGSIQVKLLTVASEAKIEYFARPYSFNFYIKLSVPNTAIINLLWRNSNIVQIIFIFMKVCGQRQMSITEKGFCIYTCW